MADLRRNFEKQMIISRVEQNEVLGKVGVSEEEARTYYNAHVSEFTSPPTVTLREVLVAVPADPKGVNVAQDEAAKEKAGKQTAKEGTPKPAPAPARRVPPLKPQLD